MAVEVTEGDALSRRRAEEGRCGLKVILAKGRRIELLVPYSTDQMRMWKIAPRANSGEFDDPSLWEPLRAEPTLNRCCTLEAAQRIAGHADSRTTKLYDRRDQKVLLEDMERIRH